MRRTSYISSRVKPWSAARKLSGSLPSTGGPSVMKVPEPRRDRTTPSVASDAQPRAHRRPADAEVSGQLALGGQPIAGVQRAALDEAAHVGDDLFGPASHQRVATMTSSGPGRS